MKKKKKIIIMNKALSQNAAGQFSYDYVTVGLKLVSFRLKSFSLYDMCWKFSLKLTKSIKHLYYVQLKTKCGYFVSKIPELSKLTVFNGNPIGNCLPVFV